MGYAVVHKRASALFGTVEIRITECDTEQEAYDEATIWLRENGYPLGVWEKINIIPTPHEHMRWATHSGETLSIFSV